MKKLEIEKQANALTSEAYLETSRTSTMDFFCEYSQRLKVVNYFRKMIHRRSLTGPYTLYDLLIKYVR